METSDKIPLNEKERALLSKNIQTAFRCFIGKDVRFTKTKESVYYEQLSQIIMDMTGISLSIGTLRDIIMLLHKGSFQQDTYAAINSFVTSFTNQAQEITATNFIEPVPQKVFWRSSTIEIPGVAINGYMNNFIPWTKLKTELEKNLLIRCPPKIPNGSTLITADHHKKKDWHVHIVDKRGEYLGNVWLGADPYSDWKEDGLVRLGKTNNDDTFEVWQIFQRYSDGSYRMLKSFIKNT